MPEAGGLAGCRGQSKQEARRACREVPRRRLASLSAGGTPGGRLLRYPSPVGAWVACGGSSESREEAFLLCRIRLARGFMRLGKYSPRETIWSAESALWVTSSPVAAQTLANLVYLPFPLGKMLRSLQSASERCERAFLLSLASHVPGVTRRALPRVAAVPKSCGVPLALSLLLHHRLAGAFSLPSQTWPWTDSTSQRRCSIDLLQSVHGASEM